MFEIIAEPNRRSAYMDALDRHLDHMDQWHQRQVRQGKDDAAPTA